ncbi:MAG: hypothetical protein MHPSP_003706, partial [Paramarteilia canceri]
NLANTIAKGIAWTSTNSDAMFAEFVHSMADTLNQAILFIGTMAAIKSPNQSHP